MRVNLRLFASLRKYANLEGGVVLEDGATVQDLLDKAGIPVAEAAIVLVDGRHARPEQPLQDGQTVSIFPPIAGG